MLCSNYEFFYLQSRAAFMKKNIFLWLVFPVFLSFILSCHTSFQSQSLQYKSYRVSGTEQDPGLLSMMKPYSDSVNKNMNDVVGIVEKTLEKKTPEGTLGNFMADAFLVMAKEKYNTQVDASFMNSGGIRLNQLPAGIITRAKIFELMPFDNLLVLQKVSG
jgi:2',3'-cyclic-nucleotide 2'-phosphodiesterase (5'-nucleotidase family)